MKTISSIILLFLCLSCLAMGQTHVETRMTLNELGKSSTVVFGVDTAASDSVDRDAVTKKYLFGEIAGIPAHPPSGLHSAFVIIDLGDRVFSYYDIRKLQSTTFFSVEHELSVSPITSERGTQLIFTWAYPLHPNIDSIVLTDFTEIITKIKFSPKGADTLKGDLAGQERFKLKVYYNFTPVSVKEEQEQQGIIIYPNPCAENIVHIETPEHNERYTVTDIQGEQITEGEHKGSIDVSGWAQGTYFIRFFNGERSMIKRFVKL